MREIGNAYRGCRRRISELVAGLDGRAGSINVPACPDWSVHDVVSHVTGGITDFLEGRTQGAGTDPWTARQVRERRESPIAVVLDEWNTNAPKLEPLMDEAGDIGRQAVTDVVTHEHDIRGALGRPGERDSDAIAIGVAFAADRLVESAAEHGVRLAVHATDGSTFGPSDANVRLSGEPFELLRAMTGRRSVDQLIEMRWDGDPERVIPAFSWAGLSPARKRIDE